MTSLRSASLAVAVAALLLACSSADEPTHTVTSTGSSDAGTTRAEPIAARQGQGTVELPGDFPGDVPIYSPGTLEQVHVGDGKHAASFTTEASSQEVAAFYREELSGNSWNLEKAIEFGGQVMLSGTKQGRRVSVFIMGREELTTVAVSISGG
jgi:hypothetical protein